jgi:hypothetical protein
MRRVTMFLAPVLCVSLLGACAEQEAADETMETSEPAATEAPEAPAATVSLEDFAGTWNATTYLESGDTVEYTMTATADTTGWIIDLPDRDPMPMRFLAVEGDSVVTEIGPYESILREGVMVTVRSTSRLQDGGMVGTMEATYAGGEGETVVGGRVEGTRGGM